MCELARSAAKAINEAASRLADAGIESSRLDAELLLAAAAGVTRESAIIGMIDLSPGTLEKFEALLARRERREPIAYILGRKEFYSLDFEVTPAVLIPRPETEFVVGAALECVAGKAEARVLDIGTGSGAIAIAIAVNGPSARVTAVDISAEAIAVASRNAQRHRVEDRLTFRRADCFEILDGGSALETFDLIVSNPPYLDDAEIAALDLDVRGYEPRVALSTGAEGLDVLRRIATAAPQHHASDGELIVEIAAGQAAAVANLFEEAGLRR
ncbi:MAG TPA: peptide chain release factor N(5)-glutamine methyltransferase, partial [Candidatus Acidoferrum sp.]|nr:peptide chain release factor N(5)-glutamine methyltransferase [Candidatus Acidoferrum sp.]